MTDRAELVSFVLAVADALERRELSGASGGLRVAARALAECRCSVEDDVPRCEGCDAELAYAGNGRPRRWCSQQCRDRARRPSRKLPANGTVGA